MFRFINDVCKKSGIHRDRLCFMYKGREVFESDTPNSIGLKEGDIIDVDVWLITIVINNLNIFKIKL